MLAYAPFAAARRMSRKPDTPQRTPYELLGGEAAVRDLVDRFYDLMDLEPAYARIRALHPPALDASRDKLFWFLSGWLGGPPLYAERIGHPMLRARHLPFAIGIDERDQWLRCMSQAMDEEGVDPELQRELAKAFFGTADWMRNRPG
jgi:hemoglobin